MALTAVLPGLFPAALVRDTAAAPSPNAEPVVPRLPDLVVFSSAPFRLLADLATAGLKQLATLLPVLEQAVEDGSVVPLGHLAKAVNTAARQVGDGHVALLAAGPDRMMAALPNPAPLRPTSAEGTAALRNFARQQGSFTGNVAPPRADDTLRDIARQLGTALPLPPEADDPKADPARSWLSEAKHVLHRADDLLEGAAELRPAIDAAAPLSPQINWAMAEIVAARNQVSATIRQLDDIPAARQRPRAALARFASPLRLDQLTGATSAFGIVFVLALLALVAGLWSVAVGLVAMAGTAWWVWRIGRATRGFRLDGAR